MRGKLEIWKEAGWQEGTTPAPTVLYPYQLLLHWAFGPLLLVPSSPITSKKLAFSSTIKPNLCINPVEHPTNISKILPSSVWSVDIVPATPQTWSWILILCGGHSVATSCIQAKSADSPTSVKLGGRFHLMRSSHVNGHKPRLFLNGGLFLFLGLQEFPRNRSIPWFQGSVWHEN